MTSNRFARSRSRTSPLSIETDTDDVPPARASKDSSNLRAFNLKDSSLYKSWGPGDHNTNADEKNASSSTPNRQSLTPAGAMKHPQSFMGEHIEQQISTPAAGAAGSLRQGLSSTFDADAPSTPAKVIGQKRSSIRNISQGSSIRRSETLGSSITIMEEEFFKHKSELGERQKNLSMIMDNEGSGASDWHNLKFFNAYLKHAESKLMEEDRIHESFLTFKDPRHEEMYKEVLSQNLPSVMQWVALLVLIYSVYAVLSGDVFTQGPNIHRWHFAANVMFNSCWIIMFAMSLIILRLSYVMRRNAKDQQKPYRHIETCFCCWLCCVVALGCFLGNRWRCARIGGLIDGVSDPKVIFCTGGNSTCKGFSSDTDLLLVLVGLAFSSSFCRFRAQCVIWSVCMASYCLSSLWLSIPEGDQVVTNIILLIMISAHVAHGHRQLEWHHRKQFLMHLNELSNVRHLEASALYQDIDEKLQNMQRQEEFLAKQKEMRKISNSLRKKKIIDLQAAMADQFFSTAATPSKLGACEPNSLGKEGVKQALQESSIVYGIKSIYKEAKEESERLTELISEHTSNYKKNLPDRWEFLDNIKPFSQTDHQLGCPFWLQYPVDAYRSNHQAIEHEAIDFFSLRAAWIQPVFQTNIESLVSFFNAAETVEALGLDPQKFNLELCPEKFSVDDSEIPNDGKKHCALRMGDVKCQTSAQRKVLGRLSDLTDEKHAKFPKTLYLIDWNRCEVYFRDPYCMALFCHLLQHGNESRRWVERVVRIKHKFKNKEDGSMTNKLNNLHINVVVNGFVCEVQLLLYEHAQIKRSFHKYYEILREKNDLNKLRPVFHDRNLMCEALQKNTEATLLEMYKEKCAKLQKEVKQLKREAWGGGNPETSTNADSEEEDFLV